MWAIRVIITTVMVPLCWAVSKCQPVKSSELLNDTVRELTVIDLVNHTRFVDGSLGIYIHFPKPAARLNARQQIINLQDRGVSFDLVALAKHQQIVLSAKLEKDNQTERILYPVVTQFEQYP